MMRRSRRVVTIALALIMACGSRLSAPGAPYAAEMEAALAVQGKPQPLGQAVLEPDEPQTPPEQAPPQTETAAEPTVLPQTEAAEPAAPPEPESEPAAAPYFRENVPLPDELQAYIFELCEQKGLSYPLVLSMIYHESGFDPQAVCYNTDGSVDRGLMQINSKNNYDPDRLLDPYENVRIGVEMIAAKIEAYGETYGLMAYKMGDAGMENARADGVINTRYAQKILEKRPEYEAA